MQILEKHLRVTFRGRSFPRESAFHKEEDYSREEDVDFSHISKKHRQVRTFLEILPEKHLKPTFFSNISTNHCTARNILEIYAKST